MTKKYYKDFYGCTACISITSEWARLTISSSNGHRVHDKYYSTERGAKIALGKFTDGTAKEIKG